MTELIVRTGNPYEFFKNSAIVVLPPTGAPITTILFGFNPRYELNSETIVPIFSMIPFFECHPGRRHLQHSEIFISIKKVSKSLLVKAS